MAGASTTVAANTARDVALCGDTISDIETLDFSTAFNDFAAEFMADGEWHGNCFTGPVVPLINMNIGSANGRAADFDQNVVVSRLRFVDIFKPETTFGLRFDQRFQMIFNSRPTSANAATALSN